MRTFALLLALLSAPAFADEKAAPLVDKMQKFYETTHDLKAHFDQTLVNGAGRRRKASGDVWLKKPGRMRWEYRNPEPKLMVADGKELWVYEPDDEQAFKQSLASSSLPSSVTFLTGEGKLREEFDITVADDASVEGQKLGGEGETVLKLVPKKPTAQYRYLLFVVDDKTGMVRETVVFDQQGGTNHMVFGEPKLNQGLPDERFRFSPPAGTHIIRP